MAASRKQSNSEKASGDGSIPACRFLMQHTFPHLGFGLGLRPKHYPHLFAHWPEVDWFEIISENFMDTHGRPKRNLERVMARYPIVMHGVSMSIGTVDPLNSEYLQKLKKLIDFVQPAWISDHLCWTGVAHRNTHDLLPVPYTEEALKHIVSRIRQVQDYLERPIALENPSTYLEFKTSHMAEAEFITRMAEESGCNLLLDVNNVYVTCYNHRLDPKAYIDALPLEKVIQIHLSGHSNKGTHIIDTHDDHVVEEVWRLYKYTVHRAGRIPNTMVEWDDHIPEFDVLNAELGKAKAAAGDALHYHPLPELAQLQTPQLANRETKLEEAQLLMLEAVMQGAAIDSKPDSWIRSKEHFAPQDQLNVYINAYRWRLSDAVAEDYPVLKHYLGSNAFASLIESFVQSERPEHFNIGRFALKLPGFIEKHLPENKFAHAVCAFQTSIAQMADAEETVPLQLTHLEGMTPDALMESVLSPRKALQLMAFAYPVNAYYRLVMEEEGAAAPAEQASYVAVFRHEDSVWRMELEKAEYCLLAALFSGKRIGDALAEVEPEAAQQLSNWFARWMRNGLLAAGNTMNTSFERNHYEAA